MKNGISALPLINIPLFFPERKHKWNLLCQMCAELLPISAFCRGDRTGCHQHSDRFYSGKADDEIHHPKQQHYSDEWIPRNPLSTWFHSSGRCCHAFSSQSSELLLDGHKYLVNTASVKNNLYLTFLTPYSDIETVIRSSLRPYIAFSS